MGVYAKKLEDTLKTFPKIDNVLYKYDNYTYHIQLFIVDPETDTNYFNKKYENALKFLNIDGTLNNATLNSYEAYDLLKGHKVVIAESGVTDGLSIKSMTIKSVPSTGAYSQKVNCATEEFRLKLTETAGGDLVNKLHIVNQLLGYNSYIDTPYYLSIWFTGYDNTDKGVKADHIIGTEFANRGIFTYRVIIEEVKTHFDLHTTSYDMVLRPVGDVGLQPENTYSTNFSMIGYDQHVTAGSIFKSIIDKKNQEFRESIGLEVANELYGSGPGSEPIQLHMVGTLHDDETVDKRFRLSDDKGVFYTIDKNTRESFQSRLIPEKEEYKVMPGYYQEMADALGEAASNTWDYATSSYREDENKVMGTIGRVGAGFVSAVSTVSLAKTWIEGKTVQFFTNLMLSLYNKYNDWTNNNIVKAGLNWLENRVVKEEGILPYKMSAKFEKCSLLTILNYVYSCCAWSGSRIPVFDIIPERVGEYNNKTYYRLHIMMTTLKIPTLGDMKKMMIDNGSSNIEKVYTNPFKVFVLQCKYLKEIIECGALVKKYDYLLNGVDTDVLSYTHNEDNFWYLNSGKALLQDIYESTPYTSENFKQTYQEESEIREQIRQAVYNKIGADNRGYHKKDIVLDDFLDVIQKNTKITSVMPYTLGSVGSNVFGSQQEEVTIENEEKENQSEIKKNIKDQKEINAYIKIAQIGNENMLSTGQKCEVKLKIVGDPYWLSFCSETEQLPIFAEPHMIISNKTFTKLNGKDEFIEEKWMEFCSIYRITDITTTMEDGLFTQELHGFIATPFAFNSDEREKKELTKEQKRILQVLEDSRGKVFNTQDLKEAIDKELNKKSPVFKDSDANKSILKSNTKLSPEQKSPLFIENNSIVNGGKMVNGVKIKK